MRTNKDRAERGREAFLSVEHDDNDTLTNIYDLISDLLHFADAAPKPHGAGYDFTDPTRESAGAYAARMALMHYEAEVNEASKS